MSKIFFDTDALYALNDDTDPNHQRAVALLPSIRKQFSKVYLSTNILLELMTLISQRVGKDYANRLLNHIRFSNYRVIHPSDDIIAQAEALFLKRSSKNVSYSDCISFSIMRLHDIHHAFSFDRHFKQYGFIRFGLKDEQITTN